MKFTDCAFDRKLQDAIDKAGFIDCTDVQASTFTHSLHGKDLCAQSQTGTGKTAAFLITIFQLFTKDTDKKKKALILVPTRELAVQIEEEANRLKGELPYKIASIYGGVGYEKQEQQLKDDANVIIGTPGRLIDFIKSGKLFIKDIAILVLDEADRMLDMGFYPDIREILRHAPGAKERQTMLFSATLRTKVKNLAWKFMNEPEEVLINPESITVEEITQELYHVSRNEKMKMLIGLLNKEKPENVLIFTNTKSSAMEVSKRLRANDIDSHYIMGDLPQKKRIQVLNKLKEGDIPCLVATDVAARGLHIDGLDLVVNFDIPEDCENYVHRIGRTARAGKSGKAISLACEKYVLGLEGIEKYIGMKIPVVWADENLLAEDKSSGMNFYSHSNGPQRGSSARGNSRNAPRGRQNSSRDRGRPQHGSTTHKSSRSQQNRQGDRPNNRPDNKQPNRPNDRQNDRPNNRQQNRPNDKQQQNRNNSFQNRKKSQHQKQHSPRPAQNVSVAKVKKIEDRLELYKKKYGEDFAVVDQNTENKSKSRKEKKQSPVKNFFRKLRRKKK